MDTREIIIILTKQLINFLEEIERGMAPIAEADTLTPTDPPPHTLEPRPQAEENTPMPENICPPIEPPDLDDENMPWDLRIHSGGHSKTKDGLWKKKRGVSPELVEAVKAELLGTDDTDIPAAPVGPECSDLDAVKTWGDLMRFIEHNNVPSHCVAKACTANGIANVGEAQQYPSLIPKIAKDMGDE